MQPGAAGGAGHHGELAVQQLPAGVSDYARPEVPQLAIRGRVKGQRLHSADARTGPCRGVECAQPAAHFARRALGECHSQHLPGGDVTARDQRSDPVSDGAGLAGSGTGQHAHRSTRSQYGFALLVVQPGNQWVAGYRHDVHLGSGR